ncbi:MAG: hypothetical protein WAK28_20565 [Trebonia sp.]
MTEAQPAGGPAAGTMQVTGSRFRLAAPVTAGVLGALCLALIAAWVLLACLTRDLRASKEGLAPAFALACGLLGVLVARRQPRNPEGWLLLGLGIVVITVFDSGLYAVLDYRMHQGRLPLGETAVFVQGTLGEPLFFLLPLVILLFPDGRLTRRWAWVMRSYLLVVVVLMAGIVANEVGTLAGRQIQVDLNGAYSGPGSPTGVLAALAAVAGTGWILALAFWPAFAARQVLSWRRSDGERRQQLKWLMGGAALALAGLALIAFGPAQFEAAGIPALALAALPVSMGVGILKYHLYDIDRIISRTLAYALVTGLLVGVYAGLVLLATQVLRFHSTVAVAASTLAVAALFNPVRRRVQRAVDRRFNRARYDAEATVTMFAARLKDAVDLDSVRDDLASVAQQALEPAYISVWISAPD